MKNGPRKMHTQLAIARIGTVLEYIAFRHNSQTLAKLANRWIIKDMRKILVTSCHNELVRPRAKQKNSYGTSYH